MISLKLVNSTLLLWLNVIVIPCWGLSSPLFYSNDANNNNGNNKDFHEDAIFSLSAYQQACALDTARSLDASRNHFQILFVDDDNVKGRIAEGLLARVAEHNDAMCILFPASATIESSRNAPRDAAPSEGVIQVGASLGLCDTLIAEMGTSFDLSSLDQYDLIIAMDDDIQALILRSLGSSENQEYYGPRCRLLSEFLSPQFVSSIMDANNKENNPQLTNGNDNTGTNLLLDVLDPELRTRVTAYSDQVINRSSNIFHSSNAYYNHQDPTQDAETWPLVEAALIMASAGITRFTLDTMDAQLEAAFYSLLEQNFFKTEHLTALMDSGNTNLDQADYQLQKCCSSVTGYFSPQQRRERLEKYLQELRIKLENNNSN